MDHLPSNPELEVNRLQRCINDLLSVLALPAVWSGADPIQILGTFVNALLRMLDLDFVYAAVRIDPEQSPITILRTAQPQDEKLLNPFPEDWLRQSKQEFSQSLGGAPVSILRVDIGLQGNLGLIFAGSRREGFPEQTERLVLGVGVNQAAVGLQQARLLSEQRRIAAELDRRVEQRTAELAAANDVLEREVIKRRRIEARLLEGEDLLKKSEAKLWQVIDTIPIIAWCNLNDGSNQFLNRRWTEYTGLDAEASLGWGWQVAFHSEDLPPLLERWQRMLITGEPGEIEARIRRYDGIYRWFLIRAEPFRGETGTVLRWYGTSTDIEDRKRAEEELLRNETFLSKAQRLSATGSFSWCLDTDEIIFSEEAYRIFEFNPGEPVTFERIGKLIHPEDLPLLAERTDAARSAGDGHDYEIRLKMPDGSIKYLHTTSNEAIDANGRREYIGAIQDVTQRRLAQEALNKARADLAHISRVTSLAAFTASIAHEINQPLSGIITNASTCLRMLNADPPNIEGARETATRTIRDGRRASDVTTRLRTLFSKKEIAFEPLDVNEVAREVVALSFNELRRNRVTLRLEYAESLPTVEGDRVQLQQVILNLLRNASDAMSGIENRPRQIVLTTESDSEAVSLSIKDFGIGFESDDANRLFETFYTTKHDGMGIGLSVSRSIIEAHRGKLWASRNDGPGATFRFSIPRAGRQQDA